MLGTGLTEFQSFQWSVCKVLMRGLMFPHDAVATRGNARIPLVVFVGVALGELVGAIGLEADFLDLAADEIV